MDGASFPFRRRFAFRFGGERDGRPDWRVCGIAAKPKFPLPFVIPAVNQPASAHYFENQTPALAQEKACGVCDATVMDVVLLIVSCAEVRGLFDTFG